MKNQFDNFEQEEIIVSPYDADYPIQFFSNTLKAKMIEVGNAIEDMYKSFVKVNPTFQQLHQSTQKGYKLVVDASDQVIDGIKNGKIKLCVNKKTGKKFAQIREGNKYGEHLPVKEETINGFDAVQFANALQIQEIQAQLEQISEQIFYIDKNVKSVIEGQQNDRLGLYFSGLSLLIEAQNVSNNDFKNLLLAQAIRSLTESTHQLILTMKSDIQYLLNGEYKSAKGKSTSLIDEKMKNINKSFEIIHQASLLKAGIYCKMDELSAMSSTLNEYSRFIDDTIAKNSELLSQCDINDNGTEAGVWKSRKNLKLDTFGIDKLLNSPEKTIYIDFIEENENENC